MLKAVKHYGYRVARAQGRCVTLPRSMFTSLVSQWHQDLGTFASNHETFEFLDEGYQTRYITLTDDIAIIGTQLDLNPW